MNFQLKADFLPSLNQKDAINMIVSSIAKKQKNQVLLGVTGSGKTFVLANVIEKTQMPSLIIAPNRTLAAQLYSEMKEFFPNNAVEYFVSYYDYYQPEAYIPSKDVYIAKDASINAQIEQMRLSATKSLLELKHVVVVATVSAIYGLGDPEIRNSMSIKLCLGQIINIKQLMEDLASIQYERENMEFKRGTYRVRGDNIDIYPADLEFKAIRIITSNSKITDIYFFDPIDMSIIEKISATNIYPKTHFLTQKELINEMICKIKNELDDQLSSLKKTNKLVEAERLESRTLYDIEMLEETGYCTGIENYSRYLSNRKAGEPPPTLMHYMRDESLLFIDESHITVPQIAGMFNGDRARKTTLVEHGFRLPSALDNRPLKFEEFVDISKQTVFVSATPSEYEIQQSVHVVELLTRPTGILDPKIEIRKTENQIDNLYEEILARISVKEKVFVTTLTKKLAENITKYFLDKGIKIAYLHSEIKTLERTEIIYNLRSGKFDVLIGINLLREGLDVPEVSLVCILDADKQGFLRSEKSLIQTIGRAARHINGTVIMYANTITSAMEKAINETNRRREKQFEYNSQNNIVPKSINKKLELQNINTNKIQAKKTKNKKFDLNLSQEKVFADIDNLEKQMFKCVKKMDYERAAKIRDEIKILKKLI